MGYKWARFGVYRRLSNFRSHPSSIVSPMPGTCIRSLESHQACPAARDCIDQKPTDFPSV